MASTTWIPVDPDHPDVESYPLAAHIAPITVTLQAGDALYLPALWYHKVTQTPDPETGLLISINHWYEMDFATPYFTSFSLLESLGARMRDQAEKHQEEGGSPRVT